MFCVALVVTQLVSWHAHLYDALILLIPMAWMSESESRWIRYTPAALILITAPMLLDPPYGYLLAIFLCAWLRIVGAGWIRNRSVAWGPPPTYPVRKVSLFSALRGINGCKIFF